MNLYLCNTVYFPKMAMYMYSHMYCMYSYIFFFLLGIKNIPRKEKPDCGRINYLAKSSGMFWHVHVFKVERYNNLRFWGKWKGFRNRLWYLLLVHSTAQFLSYTWWYEFLNLKIFILLFFYKFHKQKSISS